MEYPNLDLIEYKFRQRIHTLFPDIIMGDYYYPVVKANVFPQTWGSTALGFPGCGGSAMTTAYTTVMNARFLPKLSSATNGEREFWGVYFGNEYAYMIEEPTEEFFEDLKNHNRASVMEAGRYHKKQ